MTRCTICKKTSDETKLFPGIMESEMINICEECAEDEKIPIIKKPTELQLEKADEKHSVRERMEIMSGMRKKTEISKDQIITQGNLAKLRIPPRKEHHEDVLENYYWTLNIARRRAKMTINQLAKKIQTTPETIQQIEHGKLPQNFKEIFTKIEALFGIKLLKTSKSKIHFIKPTQNEAEKILKEVRTKMEIQTQKITPQEKKEKLERIAKGEIDFSRRENLSNITLNDLVEMKRQREKQESKRKSKAQEETILCDDLEIDINEL